MTDNYYWHPEQPKRHNLDLVQTWMNLLSEHFAELHDPICQGCNWCNPGLRNKPYTPRPIETVSPASHIAEYVGGGRLDGTTRGLSRDSHMPLSLVERTELGFNTSYGSPSDPVDSTADERIIIYNNDGSPSRDGIWRYTATGPHPFRAPGSVDRHAGQG